MYYLEYTCIYIYYVFKNLRVTGLVMGVKDLDSREHFFDDPKIPSTNRDVLHLDLGYVFEKERGSEWFLDKRGVNSGAATFGDAFLHTLIWAS